MVFINGRTRFSAREDPMTKVLKDENMRLMETVDTLHDQVEQQEHIAAMSRNFFFFIVENATFYQIFL